MAASNRIVTRWQTVSSKCANALAKTTLVWVACVLASMACGCSLLSHAIYFVKGNDAPAEFDELKEKRIAVVVGTNAGYNSDASGILMSRHISELFARNIKKVDVVNPEEVDRIINDQATSERTIPAIGERLRAEYVVFVELNNLKLRDGQTLFKGRCNATVSAYKVTHGDRAVFKKSFPEFVYPQHGAPSTDFDEATFQRIYLSELSLRIARTFYPYDPTIDVAKDAAVSSLGVTQ
jgi:hypothetical protein